MSAPEIKKGLEGVVVDTSAVSKVMPETNSLTYRGYPVQDLSESCSFEEVAYLLWHGELPSKKEFEAFTALERDTREISSQLQSVIKLFPKKAHPMDTVRTAVSYLGMEDPDIWSQDRKSNMVKAMKIFAKVPTMVAMDYRCRKGLPLISPRKDLSFSENFFHMCFGEVPHKDIVKCFDVSMILYAEHGFNASTFTSRVVTSTMSDMYGAVTAGIASLKGPLHGGANEQVMHMLQEIKDPSKAEAWMLDALASKKKIMGFGHRVYKKGDSRVPIMKRYGQKLADIKGVQTWVKMSDILEKVMIEKKDIHPNVDFPSGPAYFLMGFEIDMFTPLFVMARTTGWTAHIMEQAENNRLIRPLTQYTGAAERAVKALSARG
jgi:2-methylcitrate synthase